MTPILPSLSAGLGLAAPIAAPQKLGKRKAGEDPEDSSQVKRRNVQEETAAETSRTYLEFAKADTVLKSRIPTCFTNFQSILKDEGVWEQLKVQIIEKPEPCIRFQHSPSELVALFSRFPKLAPYFHNRKGGMCFFSGIGSTQNTSKMGLSENPAAKTQLTRSLCEDALRYFEALPPVAPVKFDFLPKATDKENLMAVYKKFEGLCLGESHKFAGAKKFLVDNMETLRELGVRTLFMEDIQYDTMQPMVDQYFATSGDEMPLLLQTLLEARDSCNGFTPPYTLLNVFRKAKECGIRVVGIDTSAAFDIDPAKGGISHCVARVNAMNFVSKQIIDREKGDAKFIALMGDSHATTMIDQFKTLAQVKVMAPGMSDLLQCPCASFINFAGDKEKLPFSDT